MGRIQVAIENFIDASIYGPWHSGILVPRYVGIFIPVREPSDKQCLMQMSVGCVSIDVSRYMGTLVLRYKKKSTLMGRASHGPPGARHLSWHPWQSKRRGSEDDEYGAYRGSAWKARPESARLGSGCELWPDVALWDSPYGV